MIGEVLGSYQIVRALGEGGMGAVYLAQHQVIGRLAAIKVLLPEYSSKQEMLARIFNEARLTAAIRHPGLVDIYDYGRHTNGSAYIVMEYLEGETLSRLIEREAPLPTEMIVSLGRQMAAAVHAAHEKDVIHRDLKSDNVFLVHDEETALGLRARLLDFGIAKLAGEAGSGLKTRTGSLIGTPAYMSPEQCRGAGKTPIDARSDIYSLGCVLFEMACGRRPFVFEGLGELIAAHLGDDPPRPRSLNPSLPGWLEGVILDCLEKEPGDRPQSMDALANLLASNGKSGARPRRSRPSLPPTAAKVSGTPSTFNRLAGEVSSRRATRWAATGIVAAAAIGGMVAFAIMPRPREGANPAPTRTESVAPPLAPAAPPVAAKPTPAPPPPAPVPLSESRVVAAPPVALEPVAVDAEIGAASGFAAVEETAAPPPAVTPTPAATPAPKKKARAKIKDGALDPYGDP